MDKGNLFMLMVMSMRESGLKIRHMEMESINMPMELCIMDNGNMIFKMEKE